MRRVALLAAAAALTVTAAPAQAADGPCAKQRELFEKYKIELGMDFPLLSYAYTEACRRTG